MEAVREEKTLPSEKIYRLRGPALFSLKKGKVYVLGRIISGREKIVVPRARIMCIKTLEESVVEIVVGSEGSFEEALEGEEVVDIWDHEISSILNEGFSSIMVFGPVDAGKTTLCCFIVNKALENKYSKIFVIDADIGQADIGPPTTISAAYASQPIFSLRELKPKYLAFVGVDTPMNARDRVLIGLKLICEKVVQEKPDLVVINTDGWTRGIKAHEYKLSMATLLRPEAIILLQKEEKNELDNIVPVLKKITNLYILPSPRAAKPRNREVRKMFRETSYMRFMENLKLKTYSADTCPLMYTHLFKGVPLSQKEIDVLKLHLGANIIHCEETCDRVLIIVDKHVPKDKIEELKALYGKDVLVTVRGHEKGLLVGLLDDNLLCLGIGIIEEIDYSNKLLRIKTYVNKDPHYIAFGQIKLSERGEEISKYRDWFL